MGTITRGAFDVLEKLIISISVIHAENRDRL